MGNMSPRYSSNSEALASELLEYMEDMFLYENSQCITAWKCIY